MVSGKKGVYTLVFFTVFLLLLAIGLLSEVSLKASFSRALMAGIGFTALVWAVGEIICKYVLGENPESDPPRQEHGSRLDIRLSEDSITGMPEVSNQPVSQEGGEEFKPLVARQIDPQLNRIINNDPDKMAEIVRKMGF